MCYIALWDKFIIERFPLFGVSFNGGSTVYDANQVPLKPLLQARTEQTMGRNLSHTETTNLSEVTIITTRSSLDNYCSHNCLHTKP